MVTNNLSFYLTNVKLISCESQFFKMLAWQSFHLYFCFVNCFPPSPQIHISCSGSGDASQGSAEGQGLENIQRQTGFRRWHFRLCHSFNTWKQTVIEQTVAPTSDRKVVVFLGKSFEKTWQSKRGQFWLTVIYSKLMLEGYFSAQ